MSSPRHRRKVKGRKRAELDATKRAEAWRALSAHERNLSARGQENWKHIPALPLAAAFQDADTIKALIAARENLESCATDGVTERFLASHQSLNDDSFVSHLKASNGAT